MDGVERFVTEQLAAWEVPGCAVAAVRGGKVELAGGWGLRDREAGLPVTADTLTAMVPPGALPMTLEPARGLRFTVKGQPAVTAEFELDDTGAVVRIVAQPIGIFYPKPAVDG